MLSTKRRLEKTLFAKLLTKVMAGCGSVASLLPLLIAISFASESQASLKISQLITKLGVLQPNKETNFWWRGAAAPPKIASPFYGAALITKTQLNHQPQPNHSPSVSNQLPLPLDYRISATLVDDRGRFWVGTWQGLLQIDQTTGQAIASIALPNSTVTALIEDRRGFFWVGTTSGLYQIQPSSGKIENRALQLASSRVLSLGIDRAGFIWVGTDQGLTRISPYNGETYARILNLPGTAANVMQFDNSGNMWVGTLNGLVKINPGTAQITARIPFVSGQIVQAIAMEPSGKVWAGTPRNVLEINPKTNQAIARINPVTGKDIVALASNKNGELWIGMRDGLVLANTYNGAIKTSVFNLPSTSVLNLLIHNKYVWIGTNDGLGKVAATFKPKELPKVDATTVYKVSR